VLSAGGGVDDDVSGGVAGGWSGFGADSGGVAGVE
jgi:hypothetical protein